MKHYTQTGQYIIERNKKIEEFANIKEGKSIFLISAMPGAGKTIFALQAAESLYQTTIYYAVTDADKDPIYFCLNFYNAIKEALPKFKCTEMEAKELDKLQYETYLKAIIKNLKKHNRKSTAVILDNVHLLPHMGLGCTAVRTTIATASDKLHFFVCSTRMCNDNALAMKREKDMLRLGTEFFKFRNDEFSRLALLAMHDRTNFVGTEEIYTLSDGWAQGIVAGFSIFKSMGRLDKNALIESLEAHFAEAVIHSDEQSIMDMFHMLSYLDEIPIDLLIRYAENTKLVNYLIMLYDNNVFISKSEKNTYIMHPLFRMWLEKKADKSIKSVEKEAFLNMAANRSLEHGDVIKALKYLIQGKLYSQLEQMIKTHLDFFPCSNNDIEINELLSQIPENIIKKTLWTSMAYGITSMNLNPERAYAIFKFTYDIFTKTNDKVGRLLAASGLINFHFFLKSNIPLGLEYHNISKALLTELEDSLSDVKIGAVAISIAYGGMLNAPLNESKMFLEKGQNAVDKLHLPKLKHRLHFTYGLFYELTSNMAMYKKHTNLLIDIAKAPVDNGLVYTAMLMKMHRYFSMNGDISAEALISSYVRTYCRDLLSASHVYSSLIELYDSDMALYTGETAKLHENMSKLDFTNPEYLPAFLSSNVTAYKALVKSLDSDDGALKLADEAYEVASASGMIDYHLCRSIFYKGACYTLLGMHSEANKTLIKALETAQNEGNDATATSAAAYLSYLHNAIGDMATAEEYAVTAMKYLIKNRHVKFLWETPYIVQNMLRMAHNEVTVKDEVEQFAYEHCDLCFSSEGEMIPVMTVKTFGDIELRIGEAVMKSDQLAGNFRLMVAILLSTANNTIHQEKIQSYIWPTSNKDHARKSFDNLLSRFRKLLSDTFYGINPKEYISISNGILRLTNVKSTADIFITECENGAAAIKNHDFTEAIRCTAKIKDLFTDKFFPHIIGIESIDSKRETSDRAAIKMMHMIQDLNRLFPDIIQLDKYIAKWLDIFLHETDMVKIAYKFYSDKGDKVKCRNIIKKFTTFLETEEFTQEEIDELIFSIKATV